MESSGKSELYEQLRLNNADEKSHVYDSVNRDQIDRRNGLENMIEREPVPGYVNGKNKTRNKSTTLLLVTLCMVTLVSLGLNIAMYLTLKLKMDNEASKNKRTDGSRTQGVSYSTSSTKVNIQTSRTQYQKGFDEYVCEHDKNNVLSITCGDGAIEILHATYGRTEKDICKQNFGIQKVALNCRSVNSTSVVQKNCNGYRMCSISASNRLFGDPCPSIEKYLEVRWRCKEPVAFQAYLTHDTVIEPNGTIKYNSMMKNIGNGYDNNTGIFTAPTYGHYMFDVTAMTLDLGDTEVLTLSIQWITISGKSFTGNLYCVTGGHLSTYSMTTTLNKGDVVFIRSNLDGVSDSRWLKSYQNQFSGILLD